MGFKRDGNRIHFEKKDWDAFVEKNASTFNALNLPSIVLSDQQHWNDFIDSHTNDPKLPFSEDIVFQLNVNQRTTLLNFLKKDFSNCALRWYLQNHLND